MIACVTRKVVGLPMSTVSSSILVHPALTNQGPHLGHTLDRAVVRYIETLSRNHQRMFARVCRAFYDIVLSMTKMAVSVVDNTSTE